jgi:hypothetical protein
LIERKQTEKNGDVVIDFLFDLGLFMAFTALLCGMIIAFANWRESGSYWGDCDPILAAELQPLKERWVTASNPSPHATADAEMESLPSAVAVSAESWEEDFRAAASRCLNPPA